MSASVSRLMDFDWCGDSWRVPLDQMRTGQTSATWFPFHVADCSVTGADGMLAMISFLQRTMLRQSNCPTVPLLVDENLWYRLLRMQYCKGFSAWDCGKWLARTPQLYAVWHPYKHVLVQLHRRFIPLFEINLRALL